MIDVSADGIDKAFEGAMAACFGDYDNDGLLDFLLLTTSAAKIHHSTNFTVT